MLYPKPASCIRGFENVHKKNELRQICKNARHTLGVTQAYAGSYACAIRGVYVAQARILFGPGDAHAQAEI